MKNETYRITKCKALDGHAHYETSFDIRRLVRLCGAVDSINTRAFFKVVGQFEPFQGNNRNEHHGKKCNQKYTRGWIEQVLKSHFRKI